MVLNRSWMMPVKWSDIKLTLEVRIQYFPFESDWKVTLAGNLVLTNGGSKVQPFTLTISKTNGRLSVTPTTAGTTVMDGTTAYINSLRVYWVYKAISGFKNGHLIPIGYSAWDSDLLCLSICHMISFIIRGIRTSRN